MTATLAPAEPTALYNGRPVIVLHVNSSPHGIEVLVSYDDGGEEYVPLNRVEFFAPFIPA